MASATAKQVRAGDCVVVAMTTWPVYVVSRSLAHGMAVINERGTEHFQICPRSWLRYVGRKC